MYGPIAPASGTYPMPYYGYPYSYGGWIR
jgi:hypothetical protein